MKETEGIGSRKARNSHVVATHILNNRILKGCENVLFLYQKGGVTITPYYYKGGNIEKLLFFFVLVGDIGCVKFGMGFAVGIVITAVIAGIMGMNIGFRNCGDGFGEIIVGNAGEVLIEKVSRFDLAFWLFVIVMAVFGVKSIGKLIK